MLHSRTARPQPLRAVIERCGLVIDPSRRTVIVHGNVVELTRIEFDLLSYVAAAAGAVCSRQELLTAVWGRDTHVTRRSVDTIVCRLRNKLDDGQHPPFIVTVRDVGYRAAADSDGT